MPRIRTLKPEILEDEKVSRVGDTAFRLFTSMIVLADDHGNVRADARWLQAQIWWAHTPPPDAEAALKELWFAGLVTVYSVRGGTYASLLGWAKYQRIDNAGRGRVPSPDDPDAEFGELSDSPRNSATRGEMRLDQEGDQEGEGEGDSPRSAASPAPASSKASGAGCRPSVTSSRRPSGLPGASLATWKPREAELRLASKLGVDIDAEAEKFRDHYLASGEYRADWNACFRGWLRKVEKFSSNKGTGKAGSSSSEPVEVKDL